MREKSQSRFIASLMAADAERVVSGYTLRGFADCLYVEFLKQRSRLAKALKTAVQLLGRLPKG
jgi:hypothetical protein